MTGRPRGRRVYVDDLSPTSVIYIWLSVFWWHGLRDTEVRYFYRSESDGGRIAALLARVLGLAAVETSFRIHDVRAPDGDWVVSKVYCDDSTALANAVWDREIANQGIIRRCAERFGDGHLRVYFLKSIVECVYPTLLRLRVIAWLEGQHAGSAQKTRYYVRAIPWVSFVDDQGRSVGVRVSGYVAAPTVADLVGLWRTFTSGCRAALGLVRRRRPERVKTQSGSGTDVVASEPEKDDRILVTYTGKGVSLDLSQNTDLFWVDSLGIERSRVVICFHRPDDPLDEEKLEQIRQSGVSHLVLSRAATTVEEQAVWSAGLKQRLSLVGWLTGQAIRPANWSASGWVLSRLFKFCVDYAYWHTLFESARIRVFVSFYDWMAERVATDAAIDNLGGVSVSYERSFETLYGAGWASSAHIHFGFSPEGIENERKSGSVFRKWVAAGYIHDHALELTRMRSQALRDRLRRNGAEFVVTFFDENSVDDPKRGGTHEELAQDYIFLLEKVLRDPGLGLIIKPKKPNEIRPRLGARFSRILAEAQATGRCEIFDDGRIATRTLPGEVAQASDVCLGLLLGSTAGFESRLAGTRTVFVDTLGLMKHPIRVNCRHVVYTTITDAWTSIERYRQDPASHPRFGDWGDFLEYCDPYQDGKTAHRMGSFMGDLVGRLGDGALRDEAIEEASRGYAAEWGGKSIQVL